MTAMHIANSLNSKYEYSCHLIWKIGLGSQRNLRDIGENVLQKREERVQVRM